MHLSETRRICSFVFEFDDFSASYCELSLDEFRIRLETIRNFEFEFEYGLWIWIWLNSTFEFGLILSNLVQYCQILSNFNKFEVKFSLIWSQKSYSTFEFKTWNSKIRTNSSELIVNPAYIWKIFWNKKSQYLINRQTTCLNHPWIETLVFKSWIVDFL